MRSAMIHFRNSFSFSWVATFSTTPMGMGRVGFRPGQIVSNAKIPMATQSDSALRAGTATRSRKAPGNCCTLSRQTIDSTDWPPRFRIVSKGGVPLSPRDSQLNQPRWARICSNALSKAALTSTTSSSFSTFSTAKGIFADKSPRASFCQASISLGAGDSQEARSTAFRYSPRSAKSRSCAKVRTLENCSWDSLTCLKESSTDQDASALSINRPTR